MKRASILLVVISIVGMAASALADDVDIELQNKVPAKHGLPSLTLHINAPIASASLELEGGGKTLHLASGPQKAGATKRFTIDPGPKAVEYTGTLTVKYPAREGKEDATLSLHFVAEVVQPLAMNVSPGDIDLAKDTLRVAANRPIAKVEVELFGEDGASIGGTTQALDTPSVDPVTVSWKHPSAPVLKLHLQVTDADGFFTGLDLFPWRVDVPHQDVNFASGSAAIPASETAKLDAALEQIKPQVERARHFAEVKLFVVGHTDTVGSEATNQKLSEDRARAIAGYFRAHGVSIGIELAGMGQKALLVPTPPQTDEPRNRRAEYVLSVGEPGIAHATGEASWHKL